MFVSTPDTGWGIHVTGNMSGQNVTLVSDVISIDAPITATGIADGVPAAIRAARFGDET